METQACACTHMLLPPQMLVQKDTDVLIAGLCASARTHAWQAWMVQHGHGHGHGHCHCTFIKTSTRDDRRLNRLNGLKKIVICGQHCIKLHASVSKPQPTTSALLRPFSPPHLPPYHAPYHALLYRSCGALSIAA